MDGVKLFIKAYTATIGFFEGREKRQIQEEYRDIKTRLENAERERYPDFSMAKVQNIEKELEIFSDTYFDKVEKKQRGNDEDDS